MNKCVRESCASLSTSQLLCLSLCFECKVSKCYIHWDELMNGCKSEVHITMLVSTFIVFLTKFEYKLTGGKHFEMH